MANNLKEFTDFDYRSVLDSFEEMYQFKPSIHHRDWPGIVEPSPSITISLTEDVHNEEPDVDEIYALFKKAFNRLSKESKIAYMIDWHHQCYYAPDTFVKEPWVYPDGDYYLYLSNDLKTGTFGHPWEATICVMGEELVSIVLEELVHTSLKIVRNNKISDDPLSSFSEGLTKVVKDLWKKS